MGTPLYYSYTVYVCTVPMGMVFMLFWSEKRVNTVDFAHFGLESDLALKGTMGMYDRTCCFNSKLKRKKEQFVNSKWMGQDKTRYLLSYYCLQFLSMQTLPKMLVIACQINFFSIKTRYHQIIS